MPAQNEGEEIPDFGNLLYIFKSILEQVSIEKKDKAFVIGITGIDCSGKSTFAGSLNRFFNTQGLRTQLIHLDDFHNPTAYRYSGDNQADNYFNKSFNIETIINELLIPIQQKKIFLTTLTLLNLETDKYELDKEYSISLDTVVIFEGVFLLRIELSPYLDMKIFLDIPFEECIQRAWKRDSEDFVQRYGNRQELYTRYEEKYLPAQRKYLVEYPPQDTADIIIDNSNPEFPLIAQSPS